MAVNGKRPAQKSHKLLEGKKCSAAKFSLRKHTRSTNAKPSLGNVKRLMYRWILLSNHYRLYTGYSIRTQLSYVC